jgi:hypothetical protein
MERNRAEEEASVVLLRAMSVKEAGPVRDPRSPPKEIDWA